MASSSLRSKILQHALPHIPEHSFTIQPLVHSLRSLPSTSTDTSSSSSKSEPETVTRNTLDILFGSELNARQELVKAWEQEGLRDMVDPGSKSGSPSTMRAGETEGINGTRSHGGKGELGVIADLLARRLEYSSHIGEHLVEVRPTPLDRSSDHHLHPPATDLLTRMYRHKHSYRPLDHRHQYQYPPEPYPSSLGSYLPSHPSTHLPRHPHHPTTYSTPNPTPQLQTKIHSSRPCSKLQMTESHYSASTP